MPELIRIDARQLSEAALRGLAEEFVSREGTDYGSVEWGFDEKVDQVVTQVHTGEVQIVFDSDTEQANLVTAAALANEQGADES